MAIMGRTAEDAGIFRLPGRTDTTRAVPTVICVNTEERTSWKGVLTIFVSAAAIPAP
jgi:hypothetical protein